VPGRDWSPVYRLRRFVTECDEHVAMHVSYHARRTVPLQERMHVHEPIPLHRSRE